MFTKTLLATLLTTVNLFAFASPVFAVNTPNFPSCVNPSGTIKAQYSDGTHGIVGSNGTYVGSDTVYQISDEAVTQCFCAPDGNGIQTDWWKFSSLTEDQVKILQSQGWIYIPNGALWGLDPQAYMAKNNNFSCRSSSGGGGGTGGGSSSGGGVGGGTSGVLGAFTTQFLASTGSNQTFVNLFLLGSLFVLTGVLIRRTVLKNAPNR